MLILFNRCPFCSSQVVFVFPTLPPFFFSEQEISEHRSEIEGWDIQRYKGLGEMNTDEAHDAIVNPETRHLIRVSIGNSSQAAKTLRILMGNKAALRRDWIDHSLDFKQLYQKQLEAGD